MANSLYTAIQQARPSGAAGNAMDTKRLKPLYDEYNLKNQENGEDSLSFEEWVKNGNPLSNLSR